MTSSAFLENYEPLDVIGNGSFGIIRKVRRKSDGLVFARKELNFERMSERDRKQIVAEVNILKDLHHDHIVRYHDRYVDRDAGILYIVMEYCGGGDLSTVIKQATKQNRPIPEDTIWPYFLQILLALHHCHHPNGHTRSTSGSTITGASLETEHSSRRVQVLHRDLKPDNVFLDENNSVKLGDFGLSKALAQASFANTYVGTPYYMSPELMQEKAYDSKSDIWSLGCLIYELCSLKPPFYEAKTHSELSIFIRNGRIPPLPRGYSQALTSVVKSMLNLNPAMRPSAAQLLQHERLELVYKVAETERMLVTVKEHRAAITAKEHEVLAREKTLHENEQRLASLLDQKDQEIASLQQFISQLQEAHQFSRREVEFVVKEAVARREDELRILVMKREEEVATAISKREEEIMEAVRAREAEVDAASAIREEIIKQELNERLQWVLSKENELRLEETRLEEVKAEMAANMKKMELALAKGSGRKTKAPLEEVKNLLEPLQRVAHATQEQQRRRKFDIQATPRLKATPDTLETPITRPAYSDYIASAMKGVVLTSTGETLTTPKPADLANLFERSPKVGLNFNKIFDFEESSTMGKLSAPFHDRSDSEDEPDGLRLALSPISRKEEEINRVADSQHDEGDDWPEILSSSSTSAPVVGSQPPPPTRIRRPSIRTSARSAPARSATLTSDPAASSSHTQPKPLPHPHLRSSTSNSNLAAPSVTRATTLPVPVPRNHPSPEYDFADEENLPSPFPKRVDKQGMKATTTAPTSTATTHASASPSASSNRVKRRGSSGLLLRAAAANNAGRRSHSISTMPNFGADSDNPPPSSSACIPSSESTETARPSLASARKASEEARKALLRP
ncbi:hypothetical protein GALMADRAFT_111919 [Galerina marginata CBS 339.88]|uniref:non-specific serine/threonine protein kinase n=1 Tax=Galerina marginata (strain CBS 339.88) TaxID=685588 RepID=A0A067TXG6_GALM3|nr:hypothetical protein GALMADRAFT_111919 [Galerina marginata CBS 339.88]